MSPHRHPLTGVSLAILLLFLTAGPTTAHAQNVRIETKVENFTTKQFLCGCPSYGGDSAFVMDLMKVEVTNQQVEQLLDLINDFEAEHGVRLTSHTQVRDFVTKLDNIQTVARGPLDGPGKALCDFLKTLQK